MLKRKLVPCLLLIISALSSACAQEAPKEQKEGETFKATKNQSLHEYGGWYCPDNLSNFPPVSAADYRKVDIVSNRLPSKEETRSGKSLMYLDPEKYPQAKAVDLNLPRMAKYYSANTRQVELVIIIQAVTAEHDTVVGFRYLDGGNGSSWLNEVDLLSHQEASALSPRSYVFLETELNTSKEKVWEAFAKTDYAKELSITFEKEDLFANPWSKNTQVELIYKTMEEEAKGYVMNMYGNIYLQIDYAKRGQQSIEKILILDTEDKMRSRIQAVFGPYLDDYKMQEKRWNKWLKEVETQTAAAKK